MRRFPNSTQSPLLCLAIALACAASAEAQSASSGSFGGRSMGSSFTPSGSSFGGTGASGMAPGFGGVSGMGAGGMGGAGGGVAGATTRGDTTAGQISGGERFVRGARQPGQFVGSDSRDTTNIMSQLSAYSALQSGLGRNNNDASNANRQSATAGMRNSRVKMPRIQQSVGFDFVPPKAETVDAVLQSRYAMSPRMSRIGSIAVQMEGRTAILTGVVATAHDRALAEQLARLEAGVSGVRNELTIVPTFATPAAVAPPVKATPPDAVLPPETPSVPRK